MMFLFIIHFMLAFSHPPPSQFKCKVVYVSNNGKCSHKYFNYRAIITTQGTTFKLRLEMKIKLMWELFVGVLFLIHDKKIFKYHCYYCDQLLCCSIRKFWWPGLINCLLIISDNLFVNFSLYKILSLNLYQQ